jgi:hypothetical protein
MRHLDIRELKGYTTESNNRDAEVKENVLAGHPSFLFWD